MVLKTVFDCERQYHETLHSRRRERWVGRGESAAPPEMIPLLDPSTDADTGSVDHSISGTRSARPGIATPIDTKSGDQYHLSGTAGALARESFAP